MNPNTPETSNSVEKQNPIDINEYNINSAKDFAEKNPLPKNGEGIAKLNDYGEKAGKTFNKNQENKDLNSTKTKKLFLDLKSELQTPREKFNELNKGIEAKSELYKIEQDPKTKEELRKEVISLKIQRNDLNNRAREEKIPDEDYNPTQFDLNEEKTPFEEDVDYPEEPPMPTEAPTPPPRPTSMPTTIPNGYTGDE